MNPKFNQPSLGGFALPTSQTQTQNQTQARNPLHGVTLEAMLNELVAHFGWPELGFQIHIRCFVLDPSIASSLKFLRKTPWAREKVESLYLFMRREQARIAKIQASTDAS